MTLLDTFVTKTENLEQSLTLIQRQGIPDSFTKEFLERAGFVLPNSVHYLSLFKGLGLIDEKLQPVLKYYRQFVESADQARGLIADRMKEAYTPIFKTDAQAHKMPKSQIYDQFKKVMGAEKSDTFVHLVADTFIALANYADWETTARLLPEVQVQQKQSESEEKQKPAEHQEFEARYTPHVEFITELMNGASEHRYEHQVAIRENENCVDSYQDIHPGIIEQSGFDKKSNSAADSLTPHEEFLSELMDGSLDHEYRTEITTLARKHNQQIILLNNLDVEKEYSEQSPTTKVRKIETEKGKFKGEEVIYDGQQNGTDNEKTILIKKVLFKRAELLIKLQQYEAAVNAYDDIIHFANKSRSVNAEKVEEVMYKKAVALEQTANYEEALIAYNQLIGLR